MPSLNQVLQSIASNIGALYQFLMLFSYLIGTIFGAMGCYGITQFRQRQLAGETGWGFVYYLYFGMFMVALGDAASVMSATLFGDDSGLETPDVYTTLSTTNQTAAMLTLIFACITLFGWYALMRALWIFAQQGKIGGHRENGLGGAWARMVGGTLAANAHLFCIAIEWTCGYPDLLAPYLPA